MVSRSMRFGRTIAGISMLVIGLGCASSGINKGDLSIISVGEEWELGEQLATDIAKEMKVLDAPGVNEYIDRLGQKIVAQAKNDTPVASQPWHFHVVDDPSINAFNIPGGHVYVNSGLVAAADSYNELASVMGHEVSHGLARHGVENMTKQYGIAVAAALVLGNDPNMYAELLAGILAGGAIMQFSQGAEREADRLGIGYVYEAGIDPRGMVSFFQKLVDLRERKPGSLEQFFSSHPLTEDRIRAAESQISQLAPQPLVTEDPGFADFQSRVASLSEAAP